MSDVKVPSVFVLEDHPATRTQLANVVQEHEGMALAGSAGSLEEALTWWRNDNRADVALVDIGLPDGSGIDFIREISASDAHTAVLVITALGDEKSVVQAIESGATGYLLKERGAEHVTESILTVLGGGSPISPSIARHLLKRFQEPEPPCADEVLLTNREEEVLRLVVKGFSYKEIGENLGMSVHTVTTHIQHIYRKLSVRSRGEAVFEAIQLGLVEIR